MPVKQANQAILSSTNHRPISTGNKRGSGPSAAIAASMSRRDAITVPIIAGQTTSSIIVRIGRPAVVTSEAATAIGADYSAVAPKDRRHL